MATNGIYLIKHRRSMSCYIGQAIHIEARWNEHKRNLRKNADSGWYKNAPSYDPSEYDYEILEVIDDRLERAVAEAKWEAHYRSSGFRLLNAAPTGNIAPDGEGLPVRNLDTNDTYDSAAEASRVLGLGSGTVSKAARLVELSGGFRWAFLGEETAQLEKYRQAAIGNPVGRPFPREGTSSHRIWSKCIELNNPSNAVLYAALPDEKRSQISIEARECRRAHGWKSR